MLIKVLNNSYLVAIAISLDTSINKHKVNFGVNLFRALKLHSEISIILNIQSY